MVSKSNAGIHRKLPPLELLKPFLFLTVLLGAAVQICGFVPATSPRPALVATQNQRILHPSLRERRRQRRPNGNPTLEIICLRATGGGGDLHDNQKNQTGDNNDEDFASAGNFFFFPTPLESPESSISSTVVVMDWECLLDALPYHIELGIHAARTAWPHLNDLCNFDTDREWLENKLFAMSHVLGSPEGPDKSRHIACEYALATRLILEEQALDRNESTGKNGKYALKFHPRSEINGSNDFKDQSRSRRPLTAGELAVNWREFIRSTLIVKYARGPDGRLSKQNPMDTLEEVIEEYLKSSSSSSSSSSGSAATGAVRRVTAKSLPLFPQTKFALKNSSSKLVVRICHRFDTEIVSRSLNKELQRPPTAPIAKAYQPEDAIRRLFVEDNANRDKTNKSTNIVLLARPDERYQTLNPREGSSTKEPASDEHCLKDIMKYTHQWDNRFPLRREQTEKLKGFEAKTPSIVWIDSSWHRLQALAPVFGDTIPGGRNGNRNTARCSFAEDENDEECSFVSLEEFEKELELERETDNGNRPSKSKSVWLSLWLAEWPSQETSGAFSSSSASTSSSSSHTGTTRKNQLSSSQNIEAAMVYPWTDSLSWETAEDFLIPATWGSSDTAFQ